MRIPAALAIFTAIALTGCDAPDVAQAKRFIVDQTRDPESVRFRDVRMVKKTSGARVVCGEFNAKNAYGAYVGYRKFYMDGSYPRTEGDSTNFNRSVSQIEADTRFIIDHAKLCHGMDLGAS